jgi:hypothetical protein
MRSAIDGDLYNDQRYFGTWSWLGKNRIHATTPPNATMPKVVENSDPDLKDMLIRVLDESGATLPEVMIREIGSSTDIYSKTGIDGSAHIGLCDEFEIWFMGYHGRYRKQKKESNIFTVTFTFLQLDSWTLDEIWQIEKGRLFFQNDNGKLDKEFWLEKIRKTEEKKNFILASSPTSRGSFAN